MADFFETLYLIVLMTWPLWMMAAGIVLISAIGKFFHIQSIKQAFKW